MGRSRGSQHREMVSHNGNVHRSPPRSRLISKLEESDGQSLCLVAAACTLLSTVCNFQVFLLSDDDGFTNKEISEFVTGTMEFAICYSYIFLKLHELILPNFAPLKSWIKWGRNFRIFRDTGVFVTISYLLLLDISWRFVSLAIFPVMAIAFIGALYFKLDRHTGDISRKVTGRSSKVDEKTIRTPVKLQIIVVATFGALLVMDQLDDDTAMGFAISQFLLFLSSTVAALTRMMIKLPTGPFPGSAPAAELLHKTLLLLLLVTAHTLAAEWLGEDVVLFCMPEVVPVLLWYSLHLDRPHHSPLISVVKMKPHMKGLIALCTLVVAPLFAYMVNSMDVSGLSWCTRIMVSCGVSGALTYYLVFMLRSWHWPRQREPAAAGSSKDDVVSSGMLKFLANALLITAALLLLLWYMVSVRLGLETALVDTLRRNLQQL
ncbi:uncharacterized protein LOC123442380 [Hordeum vulgare subsp. vulgare]|uniref:Uncharacterized protein n=1 Tax=Hordeum vulgare subsp. vulgare TaxID=112509 RepID=A0A8I6WMG9_HORVV|nr:uncharacterized protein LOC123442380 [Hordeum vulgare subsp. vulgare]XP_044974334.1 uncharacterized protein LOC123442380 [Hordeum vulgare subsp. vulgare]XP_044974335.1 uncharacterized protein LOC123442380 [Hordeum vulgare subsp. vulgare]